MGYISFLTYLLTDVFILPNTLAYVTVLALGEVCRISTLRLLFFLLTLCITRLIRHNPNIRVCPFIFPAASRNGGLLLKP